MRIARSLIESYQSRGAEALRRLKPALLLFCIVGWAQQAPPLVPLLWTQGQSPDQIRTAIREVADGGNTGFVWESRPHPDYLGTQWWSDLRVAVDEAKRLKLEVWIFDAWMYPSGVAGGKLVAARPEFALRTVEERSVEVRAGTESAIPSPLGENEKLISVVAFPTPPRAGVAPVALDRAERVRWTAPQGRWRICWTVERSHLPRPGWRSENMI